MRRLSAFTLVELLVVIAVLAILAAAVVIVINPTEMIAQSRDSQRMIDLKSVNKVIIAAMADSPSVSMGNPNTIYTSLPDSNVNCSSFSTTLPALPTGWTYHCSSTTDYRKVNGTGWLPINLTTSAGGSLAILPVDPKNSSSPGRQYYTYMIDAGKKFETGAEMESQKFAYNAQTDGGDQLTRLEMGSSLTIAPWLQAFTFDNGYFPVTGSNIRFGWKKISGSGTIAANGNTMRATGYVRYDWQQNMAFDPAATYKVSCGVSQITEPTTGGKGIYCGLIGIASNGTTYASRSGSTSSSSHCFAAANNVTTQVAGAGFADYTGYIKGSSSSGSAGPCATVSAACKMHTSVYYIRPTFWLNYSDGDSVADIDYLTIKKE